MEASTNAPLSELRLAAALRRYERIKLTLMILVLVLNITAIVYLVGIAQNNGQSLNILKCAVARSTQVDEQGRPRTPEQVRAEFERCVHG